jgi:hypothetical protein
MSQAPSRCGRPLLLTDKALLRMCQARPKTAMSSEGSSTLWETIFGKAPDPTRRPVEYAVEGVRRSELASIRRVVEATGYTEEEARAKLQAHGWSVHSTVDTFLRLRVLPCAVRFEACSS